MRSIITAAIAGVAALSIVGAAAADTYLHNPRGGNDRAAPRVLRHCSLQTKPCGGACIPRDRVCHVPIGVTVPPHLNPARANANAPR